MCVLIGSNVAERCCMSDAKKLFMNPVVTYLATQALQWGMLVSLMIVVGGCLKLSLVIWADIWGRQNDARWMTGCHIEYVPSF